ncbi:MAG TPA: HNH endonuclease [Thermoanaerobaculia bacterium]|nr:HNH endonuclease [Thermoanaerobaculia bacterium]
MRIWRLIAHKIDPRRAVEWSIENGRIAVGWGRIGDLREVGAPTADYIGARIGEVYPDIRNARTGGPSLSNFFSGIQIGDLAIIAGGGRRFHVAEVTGPYTWRSEPDSLDDYQHQRSVVVTDDDPNALWSALGGRIAPAQNSYLTVALCSFGEAGKNDLAETERYSEGSRFEVLATRYERDPCARRRCIEHHGDSCRGCGLDFGETYGDLGRGFIHVHHLQPLAEAEGERSVDPISDLIPLCPNCHAMVHRRRPPLSLEELKHHLRH